ncbi:MAG: EVE domain-containing protein [Caldilineaceae bacterium]
MKYWINSVSLDHVQLGMAGGFTQANHGKSTNLKRLQRDDLIAFYSSRTSLHNGEPLQQFTAIARCD